MPPVAPDLGLMQREIEQSRADADHDNRAAPTPVEDEKLEEIRERQRVRLAQAAKHRYAPYQIENDVSDLLTRLSQAEAQYKAEDKDHRFTIDVFRQQEAIWEQKFAELTARLSQAEARKKSCCV